MHKKILMNSLHSMQREKSSTHTSSSDFVLAFELGESAARFLDLSMMDGVEAGLGLLELR